MWYVLGVYFQILIVMAVIYWGLRLLFRKPND
jgi:hypothetical protein